jgi:hypothetical protein
MQNVLIQGVFLLFPEKMRKSLHFGKKCCTFAAKLGVLRLNEYEQETKGNP